MAKKIRQQPVVGANAGPVKVPAGTTKNAVSSNNVSPKGGFFASNKTHLMAIGAVLVVTFLALKASLLNQFTNWDDPGYVTNQPIIKDLSSEGLKNIFSTAIMGNYHPITMLTYAFDYSISRLSPFSFHLQSLLFHLATTVLVYCFVQLLTKRTVAATITAVLFGVHPMHVESVAWAAGRKDVVYGFFYMASLIMYLYYTRAGEFKRAKWFIYSILFFALSLLSKPVAVSLPVTLFAIDYFEERKWNMGMLLEKLPFFGLAFAAGIKSLFDQRVFGALGTQGETFNGLERLGLGGYALISYLWKAVVPIKLLCFYPYPLKVNGSLEPHYYIYLFLSLALIFVVWQFGRKNKFIVFGAAFFLVNIALLLQFIPVGGAIIADRYSYIPYMGLFFMLGWWGSTWFEPGGNQQTGKLIAGAVGVYVLVLSFLTNERCKVWYDGMSLWRDEIEVEPTRAPNGYNNLGFFYFSKFNAALDAKERKLDYDSSLYLLTKAIELQSKFVNPYISLAELHRTAAQYDQMANNIPSATQHFVEARNNYYKALKLDTSDQAANAYIGLAIMYSILRANDSALYCFNQTLRLKPYNPEAHSNFANFLDMNGRHDSALVQYGIAVQQNPDIVAPWLNRGRALQRMNRCDEAFKDFARALEIDPDMGEVYYARSMCYAQKGNKGQALQDVQKAISLGFNQIDNNYYQGLKR